MLRFRVVIKINEPWYFVLDNPVPACAAGSVRQQWLRAHNMLELSSNSQLPFQPKPRSEVPQAQQEHRLSHPKGYKCLQGEHQQNMPRLEPWKGKNIITAGRCQSTRSCSSQMENYWAKKLEMNSCCWRFVADRAMLLLSHSGKADRLSPGIIIFFSRETSKDVKVAVKTSSFKVTNTE